MSAILPEDSGVIRCICDFSHDDNFTIQCEQCNAWQHAKCLNIRDDSAIPENYVCPNCRGVVTSSDKSKARNLQRNFLLNKEKARRPAPKLPEIIDESGENKPRRGRKKTEQRTSIPGQSDDNTFTPQFCNIPATTNVWSPLATEFWQQIPTIYNIKPVSHREIKNLVSTRVVRHKSLNKWRFGLNDGALAVDANVSANKVVCEVIGEIMLRTEFADLPANQFQRLGCPKRGAFFVPGLPLALDCRRRGSQAVFLRRSVEPNSRLVTRRDVNDRLRVFVVSRRSLRAGEELTLGYLWPSHHPMVTSELDSAEIQTIRWLLDVSEDECPRNPRIKPSAETDEDWNLVSVEQYLGDTIESRPSHVPEGSAINLSTSTIINSDSQPEGESPSASVFPPHFEVVPRRRCAAAILAGEISATCATPAVGESLEKWDTTVEVSSFVYEAVESNLPPPPKKRMSLKDYMRKRA